METFEGHAKLIYLNLNKNKLTDLLMVKEMPNLVTLKLVIAFVVFGDFVRGRINSRSIMGWRDLARWKAWPERQPNRRNRRRRLPSLGKPWENQFYVLTLKTFLIFFRNNKIQKLDFIKKFTEMTKLKSMSVKGNPLCFKDPEQKEENTNYIYDILYSLKSLQTIDGVKVLPQHFIASLKDW